MSVCCECCILSCRGLCDELITRPDKSYRMWCVVVSDLETSWMRRPWTTGGCRAKSKQTIWSVIGADGGTLLCWPVLVTLAVGRRTKRKDNTESLSDTGEQAGREITAVNFDVLFSSPDSLNSLYIWNCINLHSELVAIARRHS
jgi:hypothetical protein